MPTGRVKWFDPGSGEARIVSRSGREYPASSRDMQSKARAAGAHVTFKVKKDDGVERAVDVALREGTRVSPRQAGFGNLARARHPDAKGRAGLSRRRSNVGRDPEAPATQVARQWVDALVCGDRTAALRFYAPDCVIHTPSGSTEVGRQAAHDYLDRSPLLGSEHRDVRIREIAGPRIVVSWRLTPDDEARVPVSELRNQTTLRIAHGQIAEQWG